MKLFGKVNSSKKTMDLNTNPEILVSMNSKRLTLSTGITSLLGEDFLIGFGYGDEGDEQKAAMYVAGDGNGVKVGKKGTAGSTWHSNKLKETFINEEGMSEDTTRFKLNVDMENTSDVEGTTIYNISFKEALPDVIRKPVEPTNEVNSEEQEESVENTYDFSDTVEDQQSEEVGEESPETIG